MTRAHDRHRRIVRIRTVEQRVAQQELAHARRGARQIESIIERIEMLARDNVVATGDAAGASLAAISEMSMRLAHARASTTAPLERALQHVLMRQSDTMEANVKEENAKRLLEKALRQNSANVEARENAARCFRPESSGDQL
jgi:hypothetical protein